MTTNIGQLISQTFDAFERDLGDEQLAAIATEVAITELFRSTSAVTPRRKRTPRQAHG